jgi:hypothetical protein
MTKEEEFVSILKDFPQNGQRIPISRSEGGGGCCRISLGRGDSRVHSRDRSLGMGEDVICVPQGALLGVASAIRRVVVHVIETESHGVSIAPSGAERREGEE